MSNVLSGNSGNISVHMVGIGGISMSGLAEILMHRGISITGSDLNKSEITDKLEAMGAVIYPSHSASNIHHQNLVVHTAAVSAENPELMAARQKGIPVMERAQLLGAIMDQFPQALAISGTHGKTTTTSMVSTILLEAGMDPTIHVGGLLDMIGGNTRIGGSGYFVAEACEYKDSFLQFKPSLAIVLNIDADHLDYFRDLDHIRASFESFLSNVRQPGIIVMNADDPQSRLLSKSLTRPVILYGLHSPDADWMADDVQFTDGYGSFTVLYRKAVWGTVSLSVPGMHNISNSLAAIAASHELGVSKTAILEGLKAFRGTHRRLEDKGSKNGIRVMDDYAHHPTEIQATLSAARAMTAGRLFCIFQPHTYTRTYELLDDFSRSFALADTVVVTDIYAAREKDNGLVHSRVLTEKINQNTGNAVYVQSFGDIAKFLAETAKAGDLVLTMGAGDIYKAGTLYLQTQESP